MAILPSRFIVRVTGYPQDPDYGDFCAQASKELAGIMREKMGAGQGMSYDECNAFLGAKIHNFFHVQANKKREWQLGGDASEIRKHGTSTPLNTNGVKYLHYAREALVQHPVEMGAPTEPRRGSVFIKLDDREPPLNLTEITRAEQAADMPAAERHFRFLSRPKSHGGISFCHDVVPTNPDIYEPAKAALQEALAETQGTQALTHSKSKEEGALKSYYLYSHIMPFGRYSSTAGRILLEALSEVTELKTYHLAKGRDINLEALVKDWSSFKKSHERGEFWDKKATPKDLMTWQQAAIAHDKDKTEKGSASRLEDYVHDAMYVAAMGDKAEIFSVRRAILSELWNRGQNPPDYSSYALADFQALSDKDHGYTKAEDLQTYMNNPLSYQVGQVEYKANGETRRANAIRFQCKNFHDADVQLGDAFQLPHVYESLRGSTPGKEELEKHDHY